MGYSNYSTVGFLGYNLFTDKLDAITPSGNVLINTINQYSYAIAEENTSFKDALLNSDVLLPDGVGVTAAVRLMTGKSIKKIAGADIHEYFLEKLNREGGSCFYLGASEKTLELIEEKIAQQYPNVRVEAYSPPFKPVFTEEDKNLMIQRVNGYSPDVLFVGMTAPKQEVWAYECKDRIKAGAICSIGAVFDFYAGTVSRPHKFWIHLKLEWFIRLLKEPARMRKRYLYYGPVYIWMILKNKVKNVLAQN